VVDEVVDEVVDKAVGEVVGRSSNPIPYISHSRRKEPKFPNPERQESDFVAYWWRTCGVGGPGTFDPHLRTRPSYEGLAKSG
jgi:hypothetical protein